MYNVDLEELTKINRISDVTNIETGQLILVPYRENPVNKYATDDFVWPLRGKVISGFGQDFYNMVNKGINIQPYGNADVIASRSGKVVFYSDGFYAYGKTLIIDHGEGFSTVYAGLTDIYVKAGDSVQGGSAIASIRPNSKNTCLHFEIRKGHLSKNPYFYLPR